MHAKIEISVCSCTFEDILRGMIVPMHNCNCCLLNTASWSASFFGEKELARDSLLTGMVWTFLLDFLAAPVIHAETLKRFYIVVSS